MDKKGEIEEKAGIENKAENRKKKGKREKKNKKNRKHIIPGNKRKITFIKSIKVKLIAGFLISVLFIIALGIISYQKAAESLKQKYEQSTQSALDMTQKYLGVIFKEISAKTVQINTTDIINQYYGEKHRDGSSTEDKSTGEIRKMMTSLINADEYLQDIYIIPESGQGFSSGEILQGDYYSGFLASAEGQKLTDSQNSGIWVGQHSYLDEQLKMDSSDYSLSYITYLQDSKYNNIGFVIMDLKTGMIESALRDMRLDDRAVVGFITEDGNEVRIGEGANEFSFIKQPFYSDSLKEISNDKFSVEGIKTVDFKGQAYRYIYQLNNLGGVSLCALIPETAIIESAIELKNITLLIVLAACMVAGMIGTVLATGISKTINLSNDFLAITSEGDLTANLTVNRKDEFSLLTAGIMNTVLSMKNLIGKMTTVSYTVASTSENVGESAEILLQATKDITHSVNDISQGVVSQAQDAENCLIKMESLSDRINLIKQNTNQIKQLTNDANITVTESLSVINELSKRAQDTNNITQNIISDIKGLQKQTVEIVDLVEMIYAVSKQSNLLSLNASIEAARAGVKGKGFAVVAEEMRKFAEQSNRMSSKIADIIAVIQNKTQQTVATAEEAETILESQKQVLNSTVTSFQLINCQVTNLTENLAVIIDGIDEIENSKNDTLYAIESISSISEETAAAAEELSAAVANQLEAVETLHQSVNQLQENAGDLNNSVKVFKL